MKFIALFCLFVSVNSFAQNERQKKIILQERMDSEFGIFHAKDVGLCRYELVGPKVEMKRIFENEDMNFEKCQTKAQATLNANNQDFKKALVKHSSKEKWVVLEKK